MYGIILLIFNSIFLLLLDLRDDLRHINETISFYIIFCAYLRQRNYVTKYNTKLPIPREQKL